MNPTTCTVLSAIALGSCAALAAGDVLDQSQTMTPNGNAVLFCCGGDAVTHQQQVTCGISGRLTRIEFLMEYNKVGSSVFFVNLGAAPQTDANDFEQIIDVSVLGPGFGQVWLSIDVSAANIELDDGEVFVIGATGTPTMQAEFAAGVEPPGGPYAGGDLWSRRDGWNAGQFYADSWFDLSFRTYMEERDGCRPDLTTTAIPGTPGYAIPNGFVNNDDFFYYLSQFAAGNVAVADMTTTAIPGSAGYGVPNGIINNDDFFYYLALFAAGC